MTAIHVTDTTLAELIGEDLAQRLMAGQGLADGGQNDNDAPAYQRAHMCLFIADIAGCPQ